MADVRYVITVDSTGATKSVQTFDKAIEDLGKTSATVKASTSSFGSEFMKNLIPAFTAATLAADAVRKGLRFIKDQLVETVGAAIEAEKVDRALESSIMTVGEASGGTARAIQAYAAALQKKTLYDDEAIKSAQALIIQMRGTTAGLGEATRGAIGLASAFGMDLQSAARAVAQGMEGNYVMLGRMIPAIRSATTEAEKHAAMMDAFAGAYKRAEDETHTFSGQLTQLKKTYGELQETLGGMVTNNALLVSGLNSVKDIVQWINDNAARTAGGIMSLFPPGFAQGLAMLTLLGAKAKDANEKMAMSRTTLSDYGAVVWRGLDALKNFNPYMTAFVGRFDVAPVGIARTTAALNNFRVGVTALEQNTSRSGWLAILGGMHTDVADTWAPKNLSVHQEVWKAQFDWLAGKSGETAVEMSDSWSMAMESMTAGLVSFGDANASVWENIGSVYANFAKQAMSALEAMYIRQILISKGIVKAKQGEATSSHIANIFKSVPFPLDLILAAGAFSVVNALFSKLIKFSRGGYFDTATMLPPHMVGEAGPEYYLPESKLIAAVQKGIGGRGGDGTLAGAPGISYAITINGPVLQTSAALTDEMVRGAGRALFAEIENQARLRGRRLTNG